MIDGGKINVKPAVKWVSRIALTLHLSEHDCNRRIVQIVVLLIFAVLLEAPLCKNSR